MFVKNSIKIQYITTFNIMIRYFFLQISVLKSQMENDAETIGRLEKEKSYVMGSVGDFKAKIAALESQVRFLHKIKVNL